jgi:hypothetical protein
MKGKEETVLEKAVVELKQLTEAAEKVALNKLADKMPKDFDLLLKEELNKIKNNKESVEESIVDNIKEPVTEGEEKSDENKESLNEMKDLNESTFEDVESAFDNAQSDDEFAVMDDTIQLSDIEEELSKMQGIADEVETAQVEAVESEDPYEKIKNLYHKMSEIMNDMEQEKTQNEMNNQFKTHMTETFGDSYETTLGEEQVNQLREMFIARQNSEPFEKKPNAVNESEECCDDEVKDVENVDEMHEKVPHGVGSDPEKGHNTTPSGINEDEAEEEDKREDDEVVDEASGLVITHSHNKHQGANIPKDKSHKEKRYRYALQKENWEKRISKLIEESKSLTKKFNEFKTENSKMKEFISEANDALTKYRKQLTEMAVFNTNLAYSNSLFVNEDIALTADDKKTVINEFKNVKTVTEAENKYKSLLENFEKGKNTINESIEDKVNDTIEPSSSQTIVEQVNEQTAFGNKEHLDRIMKNMNYARQK